MDLLNDSPHHESFLLRRSVGERIRSSVDLEMRTFWTRQAGIVLCSAAPRQYLDSKYVSTKRLVTSKLGLSDKYRGFPGLRRNIRQFLETHADFAISFDLPRHLCLALFELMENADNTWREFAISQTEKVINHFRLHAYFAARLARIKATQLYDAGHTEQAMSCCTDALDCSNISERCSNFERGRLMEYYYCRCAPKLRWEAMKMLLFRWHPRVHFNLMTREGTERCSTAEKLMLAKLCKLQGNYLRCCGKLKEASDALEMAADLTEELGKSLHLPGEQFGCAVALADLRLDLEDFEGADSICANAMINSQGSQNVDILRIIRAEVMFARGLWSEAYRVCKDVLTHPRRGLDLSSMIRVYVLAAKTAHLYARPEKAVEF